MNINIILVYTGAPLPASGLPVPGGGGQLTLSQWRTSACHDNRETHRVCGVTTVTNTCEHGDKLNVPWYFVFIPSQVISFALPSITNAIPRYLDTNCILSAWQS